MTRDQILLEGMVFYGYHGVHEEEQRLGQRFIVDLEAACDLQPAAISDDLALTVSYSELFRMTKSIVEGTPRALIESVAEAIAAAVLARFPAIADVTVTVRKPEAPIKGGIFSAAGVRIRRGRESATS